MSTWTGKLTSRLALKVGHWSEFVPPLKTPIGPDVLALVYVRLEYELEPTAAYGYCEVRAVRPGGDSTALQGYVLPAPDPSKPGGSGSFPITHMWVGSNPDALVWDVRFMQGVRSASVTTRYSKADAQ